MANTQTSVPAFTAGQVLTAAQMTEVNTGIPVFATTTTRDAAFGGTGEKVLAEGQMAYIENIAGSSAVQYYDGAAWQTLVTGGLTLISATTIGSAVSTVTVSGAFSSTYDNYLITLSGGVASANGDLKLQLGSTTTGYYFAGTYNQFGTGTFGNGTLQNTTYFPFGKGSTNVLSANAFISGPNLAKRTTIWVSGIAAVANDFISYAGGFLDDATQYTAFTIFPNSGTLTGGTIRVYGYQNS